MRRQLGFIIKLAVIVALVFWLADQAGSARIVWHGYIVETSAAFLCGAVIALALLIYGLHRAWRLLRYGPELWRSDRALRKLRQGTDDVTAGLVAIASGDTSEAGRLSRSAHKKMGSNTLTQLLQAQAAQLAGDHSTARKIFAIMTQNQDSAVLGYRGLIMAARRENDFDEMNRLADELQHVNGNVPFLIQVRFELAVRKQKWGEAAEALSSPHMPQIMDTESLRRAQAALWLATTESSDVHAAMQTAQKANKLTPDWLPAILALARCQMNAGHHRAAMRTIERNWAKHAHPELAVLYTSDAKSPLEKVKRIEHLYGSQADASLGTLLCAEAALEADLWGEARRYLQTLVNRGQATQYAYRLFAKLERREHGDERAATLWITQAVDATPDPVWLCQACGGANEQWQASCPHCHNFLTMHWQSPGISRAGTTSLPLLAVDVD